MRIKSKLFMLIIFLLLLSPTVSVIAHPCDPPCQDCQTCEAGVCVDDDDECDDCESCVNGSCESDCSPTQTCCNGTCCDNCCDGITCYDPATENCCNDGYGTVCSGSFPCCADVPGLASTCTNYCHDSVCCSSGQWCCDSVCCDYPCCGTEGCCGAPNYCCGDPSWNELCCDADEVCCWELIMPGFVIEYYCNPPCTDAVTDTTTCSQDNEELYECIACLNRTDGPCSEYTYRDYTGLEISTCYDGCPQFDYNTSNEICYEERYCFGQLKTLHLCTECDEGILCINCDIDLEADVCQCDDDNLGCAVAVVACSLIINCWDCGEGGSLVSTVRRETCSCQ